jgi:hypothetical protein
MQRRCQVYLKRNLNDYRFPIATMAELLLNQAVTEKVLWCTVLPIFPFIPCFPFLSRQRGQKAIYHEDSWQWIFARAAMCSPASIWSEWKRRENMFPVLPLRHSAAAADRYSTLLFSSSFLLLSLHVSSFLFIYFFPLLSFRLSRLPVGHSSDFWLHMTAVTVPKMMAPCLRKSSQMIVLRTVRLGKLKVCLNCELCKLSQGIKSCTVQN